MLSIVEFDEVFKCNCCQLLPKSLPIVELMMFSSQMHTSPDFNGHWAAPLKSWETKVSLKMLKVVLQVLQVATVEVDADASVCYRIIDDW